MDEKTIDTVRGDGGTARVTDDELTLLKTEMDSIARDASQDIQARRTEAEDTRFCRWQN